MGHQRRSEVAATRGELRLQRRMRDWARRPGASPPMRMAASWLGSCRPTAYKFVARTFALRVSSPQIVPDRDRLIGPRSKPDVENESQHLTEKAPYKFSARLFLRNP